MPKVDIKLPKELADLPEKDRREIMDVLRHALNLPKELKVTHGSGNEHNMWERNYDHLLANAEDEFYETLAKESMETVAELLNTFELPLDDISLEKAFTASFRSYEDELEKAKGDKSRVSDLIKLTKEKRDAFLEKVKMSYKPDGKPWLKAELTKLDNILKKRLPNYAKNVEAFLTRAGLIGKIRNEAEQQLFDTAGVLVDRFPETIKASRKDNIVLTVREQKATPRKVTVLPLTSQESRAVEHGVHSAMDKVTEVGERHRAGMKQLLLRAQRERWSAQRLAQELFDAFGEQNRDWRRVAITELAMVANDAYISGLAEGDEVIGMGSENACKHCKQYVVGKKFHVTHELPKDTREHEMGRIWVGKSNYGRRVAEYIPCIPMHPNCRCRWHRISRFYSVDNDGKFNLKPTAQLIAEERERRGLPPDPNLKW